MGGFTASLSRRLRKKPEMPIPNPMAGERLRCCYIARGGSIHTNEGTARTHAEIREALGDENPHRHTNGDKEGFITMTGRTVDRSEAARIAAACGQCHCGMTRELLSSDVRWDT